MKTFNRIFPIFIMIFVLFSFIPIDAFAIDPVSSSLALAGALDAYGMYYGVGTSYNASNNVGIENNFDILWDEFKDSRDSSDNFDYDEFLATYNERRVYQAVEFEHSSGKFAAFYIDEESREVFDNFWNWLLSGPAEMQKVDNAYQWNVDPNTGIINPAPVIEKYVSTLNDVAVIGIPSSFRWAGGNVTYDNNYVTLKTAGPVYAFVAMVSGDSNSKIFYVSHEPSQSIYAYDKWSDGSLHNKSTCNLSLRYSDLYYYSLQSSKTNIANIPVYYVSSISASTVFNEVFGLTSSGTSSIQSIDNSTYVHPYVGDTVPRPVPIPDTSSPNYNPEAITIATNVPWDDTYDDEDTDDDTGLPIPYPANSIPDIIDDIADKMIDDGFAIEDDPQPSDPDTPPPAPSEVFYPLLPVNAPSFNFNFSGIWHYVREWVASIGSWFSLVFTIWSYLPYAIVVPVYATAVIVIVLGVYKRFFM